MKITPWKIYLKLSYTAITLFVSKYFSTINVLSGNVSFSIINGDCNVLNNNVPNFSKLPLIKSPRDFED
jgi:hypothetical protein